MFNIPFLKRTPETFGLDIGSSTIKLVQLGGAGNVRKLVALAIVPLPADVITEGAIKEPLAVVEAIKEAVGTAGVKSKEAAIGVSGRELIIKKVQIPEVAKKEMDGVVQLEAEQHVPFAIDEVFLDYQVVSRHDGLLDLILVAVKKSKVTEYVGVVEEAGLNPVVVDVDGFALGNQFELNNPEAESESVALIDIGASVMKTNVVRGGASIFARDIPFGGNNFTEAIAQRLSVPFEQAEAAKLGRGGASADDVAMAIEATSRELSLEVQRTFDYFASTAESERIGKIVLAGGCAQLPGLADSLSSTWGIPVEIARPFERIDVGAEFAEQVATAGPALAVAVGLALRRPGDKDT